MDRADLERWIAEGRSLDDIAGRTGRHPSTVGYWVAKHGLEPAGRARHAARGGIDRELLETLVARDLTVRAIAAEVGRSPATVRHWLQRHGLQTTATARRRPTRGQTQDRFEAICVRHGPTVFVRRNDGGTACLRCRAERVKARRRTLKAILIAEAGGACLLCGYDRCTAALEFHHRRRDDKRFGLGERGLTRSLEALREEARKCVLLCSNCHSEVEAGLAKLPAIAADHPRWHDPG